jgi:hypothetical protein
LPTLFLAAERQSRQVVAGIDELPSGYVQDLDSMSVAVGHGQLIVRSWLPKWKRPR